jgi:hypothetical protein
MRQTGTADFREKYLNNIISTIESESFVRMFSNEKAFTRDRKLKFIYLVVVIMQGIQRSIQRELNSFYQKVKGTEFSIQEVTKSAFSHARKKLKPEAFKHLNIVGCENFYKEAPYKTWNGFRLLAIDGSTLVLPNHPTIQKEYGTTFVGSNADVPKHMARISMLYDVLNFTTLDAQMDTYDTSERELAKRHFVSMKPGKDLVIMDRGYSGFTVAFELQQQGVDYCIRSREDWWPQVKEMLELGEVDKVVTIKKNQQFEFFPKMRLFYDELICRIVIVTLPNDGIEILITSLLDQEKAPYEAFTSLYGTRWNIEEAYKLYKCRLQLEAWSGKTALAVKQDFYAKVFIMTTTAVLAFPLDEQLRKEQEEDKKTEHFYKVNRTNALSIVKDSAPKMFIHKAISGAIEAFDNILRKTVEIVRPGRKENRKKTSKKPPSMNYKQL